MKINFKFLAMLMVISTIFSCTEEDQVIISSDPTAAVLISPTSGSTLQLNPENTADLISFEFSPADYGFSAAVEYVIEMDLVANDFSDPVVVVSSRSSPAEVTIETFNQQLVGLGLMPDQSEEVKFRVRSVLNENVADQFSEAVNLEVVAFAVELQFPRIYVPGEYQGWMPENENTIIYSVDDDGIYEGYVHILGGSGEFKVNEMPNWDVNYGDEGNDGVLDLGGPNLNVNEEFGTFLLTVNLNDLTYSIGPRRIWGLVGDATPGGWDVDTPLEFDSQENILTLTLDLNPGEMKFRANNDWGFNYGDTGMNGILDADGDNIIITEAGNYTVSMDWKIPGEISYTLVLN